MNNLTKQQLVSALTEYYTRYQQSPDDFYENTDPAEDAIQATEYIFEIAAEQNT